MSRARLTIPKAGAATLDIGGREVRLTNLDKPFWPEDGITKGDLIQYYADVAALLLPHVGDRAMVMKRYPHGAGGDFFFMKRAPVPRPDWIATCSIEHESGNVIDFPVVQDVASLLWVINLGCIDLNQWYATCDDVDRPDYLHFDLDPGAEGATCGSRARDAALIVHDALDDLEDAVGRQDDGLEGACTSTCRSSAGRRRRKSGRSPRRSPSSSPARHPEADDRGVRRSPSVRAGRVLVDYNQNAWGRTLASVYSVRPRPRAPVSTPVTWDEIDAGVRIDDFQDGQRPQPGSPEPVISGSRCCKKPGGSISGGISRSSQPSASIAISFRFQLADPVSRLPVNQKS